MKPIDRRRFLAGGATAAILAGLEMPVIRAAEVSQQEPSPGNETESAFNTVVDFRFAPADFQSTICFPDDPSKTVVGKYGDFRYDFPDDRLAAINQFGTIIEFTLAGMPGDTWVGQK